MDDGSRRYWHVISDIFDLLAAWGWLGGIAAFVLLLYFKSLEGNQEARTLVRLLTGSESACAVIVGLISITDVVSYWFIVVSNFDEVMLSAILKVLLYAGMIV